MGWGMHAALVCRGVGPGDVASQLPFSLFGNRVLVSCCIPGWPGTYCYASVSLVQGSQVYVATVGLLSSFLRGEGRVGGFN